MAVINYDLYHVGYVNHSLERLKILHEKTQADGSLPPHYDHADFVMAVNANNKLLYGPPIAFLRLH